MLLTAVELREWSRKGPTLAKLTSCLEGLDSGRILFPEVHNIDGI